MSNFEFDCPHCGRSLEATEELLGEKIACPSCEGHIQLPEPEPDYQSNPGPSSESPPTTSIAGAARFGIRQILGISGCVVLFVGVFAPIISVPIVGSMNYFGNGQGDGVIVLVLALASLVAILLKRDIVLLFTGLGTFATLTFTFVNFKLGMREMLAEASNAEGLFSGLAEIAAQSVQLQWGWALLVVGACLITAPIFIKSVGDDSAATAFFKVSRGWRIAAGTVIGLCVIAATAAVAWPVSTPTIQETTSSDDSMTTGLGSLLDVEPDIPDEPSKPVPKVPIGYAIVIDEIKVSVRGVRIGHIERESMWGNSIRRSEEKYLLVDVTLENTSPGKIIYLQKIWEHTKLTDDFENIEGAEFSDGFMTDSIVGYIGSAKLMPGDVKNDMIIFDLPVDAARTFRIESDPRFWRSVGEDRVREISDSSIVIEFTRDDIR